MNGDGAIAIPADDAIDIDVPLRGAHAATVRLLIASLGADAGFSVDEIDDLKLAVSEVFTLMLEYAEDAGNPRARLTLAITGSTFAIRLSSDSTSGALELDPLAAAILSSVVDEYHIGVDEVRLVKHATDSAA